MDVLSSSKLWRCSLFSKHMVARENRGWLTAAQLRAGTSRGGWPLSTHRSALVNGAAAERTAQRDKDEAGEGTVLDRRKWFERRRCAACLHRRQPTMPGGLSDTTRLQAWIRCLLNQQTRPFCVGVLSDVTVPLLLYKAQKCERALTHINVELDPSLSKLVSLAS